MRNWELVEAIGIAEYARYVASLTPGELAAVREALRIERQENSQRRAEGKYI